MMGGEKMNEKNVTKISLSTFFLILAVIVIIVMGIFVYKTYNEKTVATEIAEELQTQVNKLNQTINDLQGKIDNIAETITKDTTTQLDVSNNLTNQTTEINNSEKTFTDNQVKIALADYLELQASANCDSLLEKLKQKGKINYDSSKDTSANVDGRIITSVKFDDYKKAMLNYVTEGEFDRNWTEKQNFEVNSNGYITKLQGGGGYREYNIINILKKGDNIYSAKATSIVEDDSLTKENNNFEFAIKSSNGNCVIDYCNQK